MQVNGDTLPLSALPEPNLLALIHYFKLAPERVAVDLNGKVIRREEYSSTTLDDRDVVEIIQFAGGG